jgi:hypothetical protein
MMTHLTGKNREAEQQLGGKIAQRDLRNRPLDCRTAQGQDGFASPQAAHDETIDRNADSRIPAPQEIIRYL